MTAQQKSVINLNIGRLSGVAEMLEISKEVEPERVAGVLKRVQKDLEDIVAGVEIQPEQPKKLPEVATGKPRWVDHPTIEKKPDLTEMNVQALAKMGAKPVGGRGNKVVRTPEEEAAHKAEKSAYMKAYFARKQKEREALRQEAKDLAESEQVKAQPVIVIEPCGCTKKNGEYTGRCPAHRPPPSKQASAYVVAQERENTHIRDSVVTCACPRAERFVKGMGIEYKGKTYYKDSCLEKILNEGVDKNEIRDLPLPVEPLQLRDI